MKPREAAINYIEARKTLILCRQANFKQLCQRCRHWRAGCDIYSEYVEAWMNLQGSVK